MPLFGVAMSSADTRFIKTVFWIIFYTCIKTTRKKKKLLLRRHALAADNPFANLSLTRPICSSNNVEDEDLIPDSFEFLTVLNMYVISRVQYSGSTIAQKKLLLP